MNCEPGQKNKTHYNTVQIWREEGGKQQKDETYRAATAATRNKKSTANSDAAMDFI